MPKIETLSPHVRDLIAAGEVVERPASVVKELLENALDAGATALTLEFTGGGAHFLRVTDNGEGMDALDARHAFERHATSKLKTAEDLFSVSTLGFRGEALAAIAAVSRIDLLTRPRGEPLGVSLHLEAGRLVSESEAGCPEGTTIIVRELFFNTPARQKFLKKDQTESAHILTTIQRASLARPDVSFQLIRDGKTLLHTPGSSELSACLYALWGRDVCEGLIDIGSRAHEGITISGFSCRPERAAGNRQNQVFLVNGRPVHSRTLMAALEESYQNACPAGRHPFCALHLTLPPDQYDVNVHPAKAEIKFMRERDVFDAVYYALRGALERIDHTPWRFSDTPRTHKTVTKDAAPSAATPSTKSVPRAAFHGKLSPQAETFVNLTVEEFRSRHTEPNRNGTRPVAPNIQPRISSLSALSTLTSSEIKAGALPLHQGAAVAYQSGQEDTVPMPRTATHSVISLSAPESQASPSPAIPFPPHDKEIRAESPPEFRYLGELLTGYLLVELSDALLIIDKHAAHERLIFNRLKRAQEHPMSQLLLIPQVLTLPPTDLSALLEHVEFMTSMGFAYESFGENALLVRAVPEGVDAEALSALLSELCEKLRAGKKSLNLRDELLHTVACKAAVKLGQDALPEEADTLISFVLAEEDLRHCPHGRPVSMTLTRAALEKQFGRK